MATVVEGDQKAPFSIATTPYPGLLHFTLDTYLILLSVIFKAFGMTWPGFEPRSPRPSVNTLPMRPILGPRIGKMHSLYGGRTSPPTTHTKRVSWVSQLWGSNFASRWRVWSFTFIVIIPKSILTLNSNICWNPSYGSNTYVWDNLKRFWTLSALEKLILQISIKCLFKMLYTLLVHWFLK